MTHPYASLGDDRFWSTAVASVERFRIDPVTGPRFTLALNDKIATAGSCFSQRLGERLAGVGFNYFVTESGDGLSRADRERRQFGTFSARYGNIYTSRQLVQLLDESLGARPRFQESWQRPDGRFVDPLRPRIEPDGFESPKAVQAVRDEHLDAVRRAFVECDVLIFTLGLTECWESTADGTILPIAPGVVASTFDPARHKFINLGVNEMVTDLRRFFTQLKAINANVRAILTVSPQPQTATYEERHVLVSASYTKAALRVAADEIWREFDFVDYFPSYEIITGNFTHSSYFESNLRSVNTLGVDHVMRSFMANYGGRERPTSVPADLIAAAPNSDIGVECDEEALEQIRRYS